MVSPEFGRLKEEIITCRRCDRLIEHLTNVSQRKVRRFRDWDYWGKPLPGFGDPDARLLIVGLAPAAHGGNRTGRMFTGDDSGNWLARALYETGFANKPVSLHRDDGFELKDAYITAVVRCAPPRNKPTKQEIQNCNDYLVRELELLGNLRIILCLGRLALDGLLLALRRAMGIRPEGLRFGHNLRYELDRTPYILYTSYHPSRQNTQTGRLGWEEWLEVFRRIKQELES